jgi:hypothetical protein
VEFPAGLLVGLLVGVLVGAVVWLLLLPRTPRKVMLTPAHPRDGGDCVRPLERVYSVPRWASRGADNVLAGSHQWWCFDAALAFSGEDVACRDGSAVEICRQWCM